MTYVFTVRPLDPVGDLDLVHGWVTQERARFWGMTDHTCEEVGEVYAYLDSLDTHHAYLVHEVPGGGAGPRAADGAGGGAGLRAADGSGGGAGLRAADGSGGGASPGVPVAIFQTYEPAHDPMGESYEVREGDLGVHLFVGPGEPRPGFTGALVRDLLGRVFADRSVRRVVVEPDVLNERSVARFVREGFERGPVVDLGHKTAQLAFLPRPT
jgi:penicillin amidase